MRRQTPRAFTLVELMVVILLVSFLAALLLPALQSAFETAQRAVCLDRIRQLNMSIFHFADDHDDRVPCQEGRRYGHPPSRGIAMGGRIVSEDMQDYTVQTKRTAAALIDGWWPSQWFTPIGTLAYRGYVPDPALLYCPAYARPTGAYMGNCDPTTYAMDDPEVTCGHNASKGGDLPLWECLTNDDGYVPGAGSKSKIWAGYVHILNPGYTHRDPSYKNSTGDHRLKLQFYADNFQKGKVSPFLLACAQNYPRDYPGAPETTALKQSWEGELYYPYNNSHGAKGANVAAFDGSAQWVGRDTVKAKGKLTHSRVDKWNDVRGYMKNCIPAHDCYPKRSNFRVWAKRFGRPGSR